MPRSKAREAFGARKLSVEAPNRWLGAFHPITTQHAIYRIVIPSVSSISSSVTINLGRVTKYRGSEADSFKDLKETIFRIGEITFAHHIIAVMA